MSKYCIPYAGIALNVDFIRVSLPIGDRKLVFQMESFFFMLSKIYWKSDGFVLWFNIGKPRYLPKPIEGLMLQKSLINLLTVVL